MYGLRQIESICLQESIFFKTGFGLGFALRKQRLNIAGLFAIVFTERR